MPFRGGRGGSYQRGQGQRRQGQRQKVNHYEAYWNKSDVTRGLSQRQLFKGTMIVSQKDYREAYVKGEEVFIFIDGQKDRNRSLDTDLVVVLPNHVDQWRFNVKAYTEFKRENGGDDSDSDVTLSDSDDACAEATTDNEAAGETGGAQSTECAEKDSKSSKRRRPVERITLKSIREKNPHDRLLDEIFLTCSASGFKPTDIKTYDWGRCLQATGKVVYLCEMKHSRMACGHLKPFPNSDRNSKNALFIPLDRRVPGLVVPMSSCPKDLVDEPEEYASTLYLAKISSTWEEGYKMPQARLLERLGEDGEVEPESVAILMKCNVDFSSDTAASGDVARHLSASIPREEKRSRRDLTSTCVFTIDPSTAGELDDALSCDYIGDGEYLVGVHIADVSHFVREGTDLDRRASQRGSNVYLVQKAIPMLPRQLCEEVCSLNPGEDKLAFTVEWLMNEEGEIICDDLRRKINVPSGRFHQSFLHAMVMLMTLNPSHIVIMGSPKTTRDIDSLDQFKESIDTINVLSEERFSRTIIRSCVKLSYDLAQSFLDQPRKNWKCQELPPLSGPFSPGDIVKRVLVLSKMTKALHRRRLDGGSITLNCVKPWFELDESSFLPTGLSVEKHRESQQVIEEMMILANEGVAKRIKEHFPDLAILKRQPAPNEIALRDLEKICEGLGMGIDASSSLALQHSLMHYKAKAKTEDSKARIVALNLLVANRMKRAEYVCAGSVLEGEDEDEEADLRHYALNMPVYTSFTSPMHHYIDILVHRLMAATMDDKTGPLPRLCEVEEMVSLCNSKEGNAKKASNESAELYFGLYLQRVQRLETRGIVMYVLDKAFQVLLFDIGISKRIYLEDLPVKKSSFSKEENSARSTLTFEWQTGTTRPTRHRLAMFSLVDCVLTSDDEKPLRWKCTISRPRESI